MVRSLMFLSTPTSATGPMFRAISALATGRYPPEPWLDQLYQEGRLQDALHEIPPKDGALLLHRAPHFFNLGIKFTDYRFILNARDPRDLLCNQYHWQFNHPNPAETEQETELRRERVVREGIDAFALRCDNTQMLKGVFNAARKIAPEDRIFVGYAMYCLHFDETIARISNFLGLAPSDWTPHQRKSVERERSEDQPANTKWIGHRWAGSDIRPGRHKTELRPETIAVLNQRYGWFLEFLRRMDDPRMAETYD